MYFSMNKFYTIKIIQILIGLNHIDPDDNLIYKTTRVTMLKGFIVAYRSLTTNNKIYPELNDPIHVKDIELYT